MNYHILIGAYTGNSDRDGIYVFQWDTDSGSILKKCSIDSKDSSYLKYNKLTNLIYAVNESNNENSDTVSTFRFNSESYSATEYGKTLVNGLAPCYLELDKYGKFLFFANYESGNFGVFNLEDGKIISLAQLIQNSGKGPDAERQEKAHVHCVVLTPDEKILAAADLGKDEISFYTLDKKNKAEPLKYFSSYKTQPGSGPRHLVFNEKGDRLYVILELSGEINVYDFQSGILNLLETHAMQPGTWKGENLAADIKLTNCGRFLYASNRGETNNIALFSVHPDDGTLKMTERIPCGGIAPRNLCITPCDKYLLVANEESGNVVIFKRDIDTGKLFVTYEIKDVIQPVFVDVINFF